MHRTVHVSSWTRPTHPELTELSVFGGYTGSLQAPSKSVVVDVVLVIELSVDVVLLVLVLVTELSLLVAVFVLLLSVEDVVDSVVVVLKDVLVDVVVLVLLTLVSLLVDVLLVVVVVVLMQVGPDPTRGFPACAHLNVSTAPE